VIEESRGERRSLLEKRHRRGEGKKRGLGLRERSLFVKEKDIREHRDKESIP